MSELANEFENGVQLHMRHLEKLLAFCQAEGQQVIFEREAQLNEINGQLLALEFGTVPDIYEAMRAEASDRMQQSHPR